MIFTHSFLINAFHFSSFNKTFMYNFTLKTKSVMCLSKKKEKILHLLFLFFLVRRKLNICNFMTVATTTLYWSILERENRERIWMDPYSIYLQGYCNKHMQDRIQSPSSCLFCRPHTSLKYFFVGFDTMGRSTCNLIRSYHCIR